MVGEESGQKPWTEGSEGKVGGPTVGSGGGKGKGEMKAGVDRIRQRMGSQSGKETDENECLTGDRCPA